MKTVKAEIDDILGEYFGIVAVTEAPALPKALESLDARLDTLKKYIAVASSRWLEKIGGDPRERIDKEKADFKFLGEDDGPRSRIHE